MVFRSKEGTLSDQEVNEVVSRLLMDLEEKFGAKLRLMVVGDSKDMRAKRQGVEGVISQIKLFNAGSGWRTLTCVLVYVYAYAIGYSYYRRGELEVLFLTQRRDKL